MQLSKTHAVVVGCGGLGSIVAPYLAGAGVGKLTLVDADVPDVSNLHRQVFYFENEKKSKSSSLAKHIEQLNSEVEVVAISQMINKSNIDLFLKEADIVLECTDDMMTKYLVNDYCNLYMKPMVYGAIYKFDGYVSLFENSSTDSIHLRDIFPEPDLDTPSCSEIGVMNSIAGLIGLLQANEALKYILDIGEPLEGVLLTYNVLSNDQYKLKIKKNYTQELINVYNASDYKSVSCLDIPELEIEYLLNNADKYNVISILEREEPDNLNIDHKTLMPLSEFNYNAWQPSTKPTVFYCMSGMRSSFVVEKILERLPYAEVYSLKAGIGLI